MSEFDSLTVFSAVRKRLSHSSLLKSGADSMNQVYYSQRRDATLILIHIKPDLKEMKNAFVKPKPFWIKSLFISLKGLDTNQTPCRVCTQIDGVPTNNKTVSDAQSSFCNSRDPNIHIYMNSLCSDVLRKSNFEVFLICTEEQRCGVNNFLLDIGIFDLNGIIVKNRIEHEFLLSVLHAQKPTRTLVFNIISKS